MYKLKADSARAARELGFRMVFCGDINDFGGTLKEMEDDYLRYRQEDPLLSYQFGFHAEYTTGRSLMEQIHSLQENIKSRFMYIVQRRKGKWRNAGKKSGMTPVAYMASLGLLKTEADYSTAFIWMKLTLTL